MRKCRLSINPSVVVEVSDTDYTDLLRQGLVVNEKENPATDREGAK